MKISNKIIIIFILLISFSCDGVKSSTNIKSYKINGLKSNFSLPQRFESISGKELATKLEAINGSLSDFTKEKMNKKQVHFIDYNNDDLIMIAPFHERLPIEKLFLDSFVDVIEEGSIKNLGIDYELIEKNFITSQNNNHAFKVKFKYPTVLGDKYFTTYFLTTKNESLFVVLHSFEKHDLQDIIIKNLNKN
jgi:hypothetical protein